MIEREREKFYLTTHSTHFIYGYMASDIWLRTILIVRKETCCRHIGYSFRLAARVLLYVPSNRQGSTYHSLCYTSRGALAGTRNSSMGPPHERSIRRPIAPSHSSPYFGKSEVFLSWLKQATHNVDIVVFFDSFDSCKDGEVFATWQLFVQDVVLGTDSSHRPNPLHVTAVRHVLTQQQ